MRNKLSVPRILIVSDANDQRPLALSEIGPGHSEVILVHDPVNAVAEAVAKTPEFVVFDHAYGEALDVCQRIMNYLPLDRHPTFIIGGQQMLDVLDRAQMPTDENTIEVLGSSDAIGRRGHRGISQVSCHGIVIDRRKMCVKLDGKGIDLTATEFSVIWTMALRPGHVQTREELIASCSRKGVAVGQRAIDQHIKSIRNKLGVRGSLIETVRGLGYRFRDCTGIKIVEGCVTCKPE